MTLQSKLDAARKALEGTTVNVDEFLRKLAEFFGYQSADQISVEDLEAATWEDLQECGLPRGKARLISTNIFRGEDKTSKEQVIKVDISNDPEKHAATLTGPQLVDYYDPDNHTNPYGERLKKITEGRRCLVFNKDGSLNREITKQLVDELLNQYPEREEVAVAGLPTRVLSVGERPDRYADENPCQPGKPLRPDGVSDNGCEWGKVPVEIRQLVYLAVKRGDVNADDEADVYEKVEGKTFADVVKRPWFRKAAVEFQEREKLNTLPQLKLRLGRGNAAGRPNNPFTTGHRVF